MTSAIFIMAVLVFQNSALAGPKEDGERAAQRKIDLINKQFSRKTTYRPPTPPKEKAPDPFKLPDLNRKEYSNEFTFLKANLEQTEKMKEKFDNEAKEAKARRDQYNFEIGMLHDMVRAKDEEQGVLDYYKKQIEDFRVKMEKENILREKYLNASEKAAAKIQSLKSEMQPFEKSRMMKDYATECSKQTKDYIKQIDKLESDWNAIHLHGRLLDAKKELLKQRAKTPGLKLPKI